MATTIDPNARRPKPQPARGRSLPADRPQIRGDSSFVSRVEGGMWMLPSALDRWWGAGSFAAVCAAVIAAGMVVAEGDAGRQAGRPDRDDLVLARVPPRSPGVGGDAWEVRLARDPRDLEAAVRVARAAITRARETADPRQLGRAQAALGPWWREVTPPQQVRLLRAILRQAWHEWEGALSDLDALVAGGGDDGEISAEAHLQRATVLTVRGRYAEARESCAALAPVASRLTAAACLLPLELAQGRARPGIAALESALAEGRAHELAWGHALLGEGLYWIGEDAAAEDHLRRALAAAPEDRYTRGVLADLLIDGDRFEQAATLLEGHQHDEALLLRLAIAESRRRPARGAALAAELRARFAVERRRGDEVHGREEARLLLALGSDPAAALARARENWEEQREPWDARVLLEAALAARAPAEAAPLLAWSALRPGGWQRLQPALRALAEVKP